MTHAVQPHSESRLSRRKLALAFLLMLPAAAVLRAQTSTTACTQTKGTYICDNVTFQQALRQARSISIETGRIDRVARTQLEELAAKLGKTVATDGPGDLIFSLQPAEHNGVVVIPGDIEMAVLRIYAPGTAGGERQIVWAETFKGRSDIPWPSAVHGVIQQFEKHFGIH